MTSSCFDRRPDAPPPPETRRASRLLLPFAVAAMAGCMSGRSTSEGYPRSWPAPVLGKVTERGRSCPEVVGSYRVGSGPLYQSLIERNVPSADRWIQWQTAEIAGDAHNALTLALAGASDMGEALNREASLSNGAHYTCREGWLALDWPASDERPPRGTDAQGRSVERYLLVARDREGHLVLQEVEETVHEVAVWCGDGCTFLPVPLTRSIDRRWSRWMSAPGGLQPEVAVTAERRASALSVDDADPLLSRFRRMLPAGASVVSQRAAGDGHLVDVQFADSDALNAFAHLLAQSSAFGGAEVTNTRRLDGREIVATLRIEPPWKPKPLDPAQLAVEKDKYDKREAFVKRVLPLLPPGATLTGVDAVDGGYLIDVRCPDGDALAVFLNGLTQSPAFGFPELRGNASAGGRVVHASIWMRER